MKKEYIFRTIFWGIIMICSLGLGIFGMIEKDKQLSSNKDEINKILEIFNSNETINEYKRVGTIVTATLKGRNININFGDYENYTFKVNNDYLETNVSKTDNIAKIIIMILSDSIAVKKGEEPQNVYSYFNEDIVYDYTLKDGIEYTADGLNYNVKISLINHIK